MELGLKSVSVARDGQEIGKWPEERVLALYQEGQLLATDYYWKEGMSEWSKLSFLKPPIPQPTSSMVELPPLPFDVKEACSQPPPLPTSKTKKVSRSDFSWWDFVFPLVAATYFGAVLENGNMWARIGHPPDPILILSEKFGEGIIAAIIANALSRSAKRPLRWVISVGLVLLLISYEDLHGF